MRMTVPRWIMPFAVLGLSGASLSAGLAQDGAAAETCPALAVAPPVELCESLTALDPTMPTDVAVSPDELPVDHAQRMFDCLSWRTFVALNWPAMKGCRGVPDGAEQFGKGDGARVWETFKTVYEVFQHDDRGWDPADQEWNSDAPALQCGAEAQGRKVVYRTTKGGFHFDAVVESEQAFPTSFNTLTDQAGNLVRYEIRFNRDEFEFIKRSGTAKTGSYSYGGPLLEEGEILSLPDNRNGFEGIGALEVKASWKEITAADDASRYYTQDIVIYEPKAEQICRQATLGLLGLHVARKTYHAPYFTWATFEHVDNTPPAGSNGDGRQYTLFSNECAANPPDACWAIQPPVGDRDKACCANLMLNTAVLTGVSNHVTRLEPVGPIELNEAFRRLFAAAGSPFQHYQLIGTQFALGARDPANPERLRRQFCNPNSPLAIPPATTKECFTQVPDKLRNTSMESFIASYGTTTQMTASDSCLNCHVGGGFDSSYIWLDARQLPVPIAK
jgi:hypothetical protein